MSGTSFRALVIGSVTIDNIAVVAKPAIERITMHNEETSYLLMEQGRKVDVESISSHVGGGAANVAVSMARQGFDIDILALVGDDLNGEKIRERLKDEGICLDYFLTDDSLETGSSILISSHDQNAAIFTQRGANVQLKEHLDKVDFANYNLVYVGSLSGKSCECFPLILERAKTAGCYVATNPGINQLMHRINEFFSVTEQIDFLSLNKIETIALLPHLTTLAKKNPICLTAEATDWPPLMATGLHVGSLKLSLCEVMSAVCSAGPRFFSLTDGKHGAYLFDGKKLLYCPSTKISSMGTAGAGDAFASTIVTQLASGYSSERALYAATRNAASVGEYVDTQTGLLTSGAIAQLAGDNLPETTVIQLGKCTS